MINKLIDSINSNRSISIDEITEIIGDGSDDIPADKMEKLLDINFDNILNEDFWELVLDAVSDESLSDRMIRFLYDNDLAVISMCHKHLPDKWLIKYSEFDEEPLYIMADRNLHNDEEVFMQFIKDHAIYNENVFQYLIDRLRNSPRWKRMLIFGANCGLENIESISTAELQMFEISISSDVDRIREAYETHLENSKWLLRIAENPNTPADILKELTLIKQISLARQIRLKSSETLKIVLSGTFSKKGIW